MSDTGPRGPYGPPGCPCVVCWHENLEGYLKAEFGSDVVQRSELGAEATAIGIIEALMDHIENRNERGSAGRGFVTCIPTRKEPS